jgi:hypothetical protein
MERRRELQILLQVNLSVQTLGVDYEYGFEIVLNKEPALEKKVLDNIRMITNKSLPFEIVYTTSEENDAAVNIWGSVPEID